MKTNTISLLLLGVSSICFFGCDCSKQASPVKYTFIFNQPDGSVPNSGWAVVYEKHLDPNTGYATLRVPLSDTLSWELNESGAIDWLDTREDKSKSISVHCFSPDGGTNDNLRHVWQALSSREQEVELTFTQTREVKVVIRSSQPLPSPAQAWALYISPLENPPEYIEGSFITTSQFHSWELVANNRTVLKSEINFLEHSTKHIHLYRLGNGVWNYHGRFTASIDSESTEFSFTTNHSLSCCD